MDFHTLSRRELQALCKNNKIPANMTNVAMADALAALSHVEGLMELGKDLCETPVRRTAARTTARKKTAMENESEGSIQSTRTRRIMTKAVSEKTEEEENMNISSLQTPAAPTTQRRAPSASARSKKKAPAAATVQSAYSTRRSTRLLEKTMAELTLTGKKITEPNAIDEETPKEVNMTHKETLKPIRMEELHAEDMSKGVSEEDEVNMTENETLNPIKMEEFLANDMSKVASDEVELKIAENETLNPIKMEEFLAKDMSKVASDEVEVKMAENETLKPIRMQELQAKDISKSVSDEDEVNMTEKETLKTIKMEEFLAKDMSKVASDEDEVKMAEKETLKSTKMEEHQAKDISKSASDEDEVNTKKETLKTIKMEELDAKDMSKGVSDEVEENKDTQAENSSVIPETESKRKVVNVPDLKEATNETLSDNDEEENKATSNGDDAVDDSAIITEVESGERDLVSGAELLVEVDKKVESEEGEKSFHDVEKVEVADLDVMDNSAIITEVESGERDLGSGAELLVEVDKKVESEEEEKSLLHVEKVEEVADLEVIDDLSIVAPVCSNVVAAENAIEATQLLIGFTNETSVRTPVASVKKMKEKEELLLQVYADPESVTANTTTPASASMQKMRLLSPYSADTLKSSNRKNQSALVDENKENNDNIHQSGRKLVEPAAAIAGHANAVELQKKKIAAKSVEDMSCRELTKTLKEKLAITNKNEDSDEVPPANLPPKKHQQVEQVMGKTAMTRQALQTLPQNLQAE